MYDFIYNICFIYNGYDGNGRKKNLNNIYIHERKQGKIPRLVESIKLETDCFLGRQNRKQAGPTLGGTGILIYRGKRK